MEPRVSAQPRANFLPWDWPSWLVKWLSSLFSPAVNSIHTLVGYLGLKGRAGNVMDSKLQVPSMEGLRPCPRGPTGYSLCPWAGSLAAPLSGMGGNLSLLVRQNQQSQWRRATESPHFYLKTKSCPKFLGALENTKNGHKGWVVLGSLREMASQPWVPVHTLPLTRNTTLHTPLSLFGPQFLIYKMELSLCRVNAGIK